MASRNGLNPKIKGPKGVGFGRALPSAFGFGNGINMPGNAYLQIPGLKGHTFESGQICLEFWVNFKGSFAFVDAIVNIISNSQNIQYGFQNNDIYFTSSNSNGNSINVKSSNFKAGRNHIVFNISNNNDANFSLNYSDPDGIKQIGFGMGQQLLQSDAISSMSLFGIINNGWYGTQLYDEVRIYNKMIPSGDIVTNYNDGIGIDPGTTENLLLWYKFEQFEMLDFSQDQDSSDIKLGIRDMSGRNNHALPINLTTDTTSESYALKPF